MRLFISFGNTFPDIVFVENIGSYLLLSYLLLRIENGVPENTSSLLASKSDAPLSSCGSLVIFLKLLIDLIVSLFEAAVLLLVFVKEFVVVRKSSYSLFL